MRHYLIVGGTRGIGAALAGQLIREEHNVTIWARNPLEVAGAQCDRTTGTQIYRGQQILKPPYGDGGIGDASKASVGVLHAPGELLRLPVLAGEFKHERSLVGVAGFGEAMQPVVGHGRTFSFL